MSTCGLLFPLDSTIKIQLIVLVQYKTDLSMISSNVTCSRHYIQLHNYPLPVKQQSLTQCHNIHTLLHVASKLYFSLLAIYCVILRFKNKYFRKAGNSSELCSTDCYCNAEKYFPVCGSDNQNYYSPCHAGCYSKTLEVITCGYNAILRPYTTS